MEKARKDAPALWRGLALTAAVFLLTIALLAFGASSVDQKSEREQMQALEDSVRRSVALFYAIEGRYPSDVEELKASYGLRYNEERYLVSLDSFASNLLPDIYIMSVGGDPS